MFSLLLESPDRPEEPPRGGEAVFEGRDLLKLKEPELRKIRGGKIAMIFQDPMTSLNPFLTLSTQISEVTRVHLGHTAAEAREHAVKMLELVGIPDARARAGAYPHQLSGGMRQRVMIAMALACRPKLLIADEPTRALLRSIPDPEQRSKTLYQIGGQPPDVTRLPVTRLPEGQCPFAERCPEVVDRCRAEFPPFLQVGEGHWSLCHFTMEGSPQ